MEETRYARRMKPNWQLLAGLVIGCVLTLLLTGLYSVRVTSLGSACARITKINRLTGATWTSFCPPQQSPEPWRLIEQSPTWDNTVKVQDVPDWARDAKK